MTISTMTLTTMTTTMRRCFFRAWSSPFCFKGGRRRGGSFRFPFRCVATRSFTTSSSLSDDERRYDDECKEDEKGLLAGGASIYSKPDVYALAFGTFRDFPKEVDFLHKLYEESSSGKKLRTLLELGCGPAWHSIEHAKKVLREDNIAITATTTSNNSNKNLSSKNNDSGIVSVALDVNKEMVSYAIERASDERAVLDVVDVVLGDMRDLSTHLPEKYLKSGGYFDCATLLLGTAAHLLTCEDATRTFREAFKCLREDGIFVVEVEHPMTTLFSGELKYQDGDENAWEVSLGRSRKSIGRSDDRSNNSSTIRREEEDEDDASEREETMRVVWGDPENDFFDAKNQVLHRTVSVQKYFSVDVAARDDDDDDGEEEEEDKEDEEIEEEEENDNFEEEAVIKALFVRDPHYESKEIVKCKLFTLPELMAVANAAGFEFIECFGDLDETVRFDSESAQNMVVCFRKNGERENEE
jgi:SAM-dependent methyltransferase